MDMDMDMGFFLFCTIGYAFGYLSVFYLSSFAFLEISYMLAI